VLEYFSIDTLKYIYLEDDNFKKLIPQRYLFSHFDKQSENQNKSICTKEIINYLNNLNKIKNVKCLTEYLFNMQYFYNFLIDNKNNNFKNNEFFDEGIKILEANINYINMRNEFDVSSGLMLKPFSDELLKDIKMNLNSLRKMKNNQFNNFYTSLLCQNFLEGFFSETKKKCR
jgi:hypothetical protein